MKLLHRSFLTALFLCFAAWTNVTPASAVSCEKWNTNAFFRDAGIVELSYCLTTVVDPNTRNRNGQTPLHRAARWSKTSNIVTALIQVGADPNARNDYGSTPLHYAAKFNKIPAIAAALVKAGAKVNARNKNGWTPLHHAARWSKTPAVITMLVKLGADVNAQGKHAWTPLHQAARYSETPGMVIALIKLGASLDAQDDKGLTPLQLAKRKNPIVVATLYQAQAEKKRRQAKLQEERRKREAEAKRKQAELAQRKKRKAELEERKKLEAVEKRRLAKLVQERKKRELAEKRRQVELEVRKKRELAEKKRRAELAKRKKRLAKLREERKKRELAEKQRQAKLLEERRKREAVERRRRAELQKRKERELAEKRKQASLLEIKNVNDAKVFLIDFKTFATKNPNAFDPFKVATLFVPAQRLVEQGRYTSKRATFHKLVKFAQENNQFRRYRLSQQIKKKKLIGAKKKTLIQKIKQSVELVKKRVAADPLSPNAFKFVKIVQTYDKPFKGNTLGLLEDTFASLLSEMEKAGIRSQFSSAPKVKISKKSASKATVALGYRSLLQLRHLSENDIVFLVNLGSKAPHAYRDLNGSVKFEKSTIVACAPSLKNWGRRLQTFFRSKLESRFPKHNLLPSNSCNNKLGAIDAIVARGVDLAKSRNLPTEVALAGGFKKKTLSRVFTVTHADFRDELKRRVILARQYQNDILEGARSGFGALSGDNQSSIGCVVVSENREAHQSHIDEAANAREFHSGNQTRKNVDVSVSVAFKELQKKSCGFVYAGEKDLKTIIEASKRANLKIAVLPVWTSASKVEKKAAMLLKQKKMLQQAEADRLANLKRKKLEDAAQRAAREAELSRRQARFRNMNRAKVTSLVASIDNQLKNMRSRIDNALANQSRVRRVVQELGFWGAMPIWYGGKRQKGWEFESAVSAPTDYGMAVWKGRRIEAIVAKIRFLMKQSDLGEYSDTCWYVGYLIDVEFSRHREPLIALCRDSVALKNWQVNNRFDTRWDLGVR